MIKIHISPSFIGSTETGGIARVSEALLTYLPEHGIVHTENKAEAAIIINHGAMTTHHKTTPTINICHGLYWSRQPWGDGFQKVNAGVVASMRMAVAHTAPSEWVSTSIRRGGLFYPKVIYHGVDADEFKPKENQGYVLWNKARADFVSDPNDLLTVAKMLKDVQFHTTIGKKDHNVKILNPMPYDAMKETVAHAGVYLCTARETFGIGTLEAMAAGVPVAGWDWGGQSEIIVQGETGYLAPPGDFDALAECIQLCIGERDRLSENAMTDARERWSWAPRIAQYAELIKEVDQEYNQTKRPKVSVIVTAHNLDKYLPTCLESVHRQTVRDWECIVVDDASSEGTRMIVDGFTKKNQRIKYVPTQNNLGLPGARNFGFRRSKGEFIRHLDADDYLSENALELEINALDQNQYIHIAYGHLETVKEDGSRILKKSGEPVRSGWPPDGYNWFEQMSHLNQIPSCSMMRRSVLERSGGYRDRMKRAEDADFWCRVTSLGFVAKKITQAVTYFHRDRPDSKGATEWKQEGKEPDWTAWYPWRMGAADYEEGHRVMRETRGTHPSPPMVPFGAQGMPANQRFWYVHDYAYPVVSVIVTCGPHHEKHLLDALDSVQAQSFPDWECIVVNDTGKEWESDIMGAPFAKVVNMKGNQGASAARNAGLKHTRGKYIIWMDADDYWLPWFLDRMVAHAEANFGVIYSDLIQDKGDELEIYRYKDFREDRVKHGMQYPGSSILIPREIAETIVENQGGWDMEIYGMEDWDYQFAIHAAGFCAYHIPEALFVYRIYSSTKRERDYAKIESIADYIDRKWKKYRKDGEIMGCGCGSKKTIRTPATSTLSSSGNFSNAQEFVEPGADSQMVNLEYTGQNTGTFTIRSRFHPGITYRFGNNQSHKRRTVFLQDAQYLTSRIGRNNQPEYRIVQGANMEARDPQAALGRQIA